MRAGQRSTNLIVAAITLLLALAAGVAIPMASNRNPAGEPVTWTPRPATATMTSTLSPRPIAVTRVTATPTQAVARTPTSTSTRAHAAATRTPTATSAAAPKVSTQRAVTTPTEAEGQPSAAPTPLASPAEGDIPATPNSPQVEIAAEQLNLRMAPNSDAAVVGLGLKGDRFDLLGRSEDGSWLQVCCVNEVPVWLASGYVTVTGVVESLPVVP